jgi:TrmH family RNA methyltransferase
MITSTSNPKIKLVRKLMEQRRARARENAFPIEGARLLEEAWNAGIVPRFCLHTGEWAETAVGKSWIERLSSRNVECQEIAPGLLSEVTDTVSAQGVVAVVPMPRLPWPDDIPLLLVLDRVQDPGNLGAILRTAYAAGIRGVALTPGTVDPHNPKAVRAGMGAHFHVPVRRIRDLEEELRGYRVYVSDVREGVSCWEVDWSPPVALVVGSEAHGVGPMARSLADAAVHIPMPGAAESLNAAVAASLMIYAARRHALR